MPVVKPIAGHTSVRGVRDYLTRNGRALAVDLYNLSWDEDRDADLDQDLKQGVDWAAEMDLTRAANGNDAPWRGKRARTYMHFILSPDPRDNPTLGQLRELARAWVRENWDDYECAAVFHDDNENGVMHAHVVVNNTNLATGRRFQNPDPRKMQASAQRLARERGMSFFAEESREETAAVEVPRLESPRTRQATYIRRAEREIVGKGGYSWVADIRNRVEIARRCASSPGDFKRALEAMGVEVGDASARGGRPDWVYALADQPNRKVRGENLGLAYGRRAVESSMRESRPMPPKDVAAIAAKAIEVGDLRQLEELAETLEAQARYGVRCMRDFNQRMSVMRRRGDEAALESLEAARACTQRLGLLPESLPQNGRKQAPRQQAPRQTKTAGATRASEQAARQWQLRQGIKKNNRDGRER